MNKFLGLFLLSALAAFAQTKTGDIDNGKRLFERNGCYQCHGHAGQGGLAGARLAQTKLPQVAFIAYVRNPSSGGMPPHRGWNKLKANGPAAWSSATYWSGVSTRYWPVAARTSVSDTCW